MKALAARLNLCTISGIHLAKLGGKRLHPVVLFLLVGIMAGVPIHISEQIDKYVNIYVYLKNHINIRDHIVSNSMRKASFKLSPKLL